jgi:tyrosine-protein kinase Etk/Wzc
VVNSLVQVYLEQAVGFKSEEASRTVGFVEDQLKGVRNELDASEKSLQTFKTSARMVNLDAEAQALIQTVADTEKQKTDIGLQRKQVEFALASLKDARRRGVNYSPAVLSDNSLMAGLASRLTDLEMQKKALMVENTASHPAVKALQEQIDQVQQKLQATYETALRDLTRQEANVGQQLASQEGHMKNLPVVERDLARLTRLAKVNADIYTFLLQKREEAKITKASTISNIDIIDPAILPDQPIRPKKVKYLLLGLIVGCMAGVGAAFFQEYLDDTVKDPDAAKRELGKPVLAVIPHIAGRKSEPGSGIRETLVSHLEPKSTLAEAYRSLRTAIHFSAIDRKRQVLLVTSTFPAEGKSTTAANLAVIITQTGSRVLLIDCDLRRPTQHDVFGHSKTPGFTDLLAGDCAMEKAVHDTGIAGLDLVSAGTTPPNPAELLGSNEMRQFLESMRDRYDTIIIDAPPALIVTDAPVLTATVDLVLLVMEAGRVPVKAAQRMRETLDTVGARVAGIVMNDKGGRAPERYGYYGKDYYSYGYGYYSDEEKGSKGERPWWTRVFSKK